MSSEKFRCPGFTFGDVLAFKEENQERLSPLMRETAARAGARDGRVRRLLEELGDRMLYSDGMDGKFHPVLSKAFAAELAALLGEEKP